MRTTQCYCSCRCARTTTKVRMIAGRLQNPIIPTNISKRNVQFLTTTFCNTSRTINTASLPLPFTPCTRINHNERLMNLTNVERALCCIHFTILTAHMYDMRQFMILKPILNSPGQIDFHPAFGLIRWTYCNRIWFQKTFFCIPVWNFRYNKC